MAEDPAQATSDLSRQYGTNWTITNVATLFEWVNIAAFNIRCLELSIEHYRKLIRNQTVLGLIFSTLSGTISVSQFGVTEGSVQSIVLKSLFTVFSFSIAITAGWLKIYQIQERLENCIKLKSDWTVFSTAIASELQLPIELRRDALFMIKKHKDTYLDLMKTDAEIVERVKKTVANDLPHPADRRMEIITLPHILIEICNQELADMKSANARNKDRFARAPNSSAQKTSLGPQQVPQPTQTSVLPTSVTLTIQPPVPATETTTSPPQALPA
jgi:hypothetical protein